MANGHGGKREGAKRPKLPFKTKEIRYRIKAEDYNYYARDGETYDDFFARIEKSVHVAIRIEQRNDL